MIRGSRRHTEIVHTLFGIETVPEQEERVKGRSAELLAKRNKRIATRYYYYARFTKYDWQEILAELEEDFELSAATLADLIADECDVEIKELMRSKPELWVLKSRYPRMIWPNAHPLSPVEKEKKRVSEP